MGQNSTVWFLYISGCILGKKKSSEEPSILEVLMRPKNKYKQNKEIEKAEYWSWCSESHFPNLKIWLNQLKYDTCLMYLYSGHLWTYLHSVPSPLSWEFPNSSKNRTTPEGAIQLIHSGLKWTSHSFFPKDFSNRYWWRAVPSPVLEVAGREVVRYMLGIY